MTSFSPAALGHQRKKPVAFTGVVTPGEGQALRITVTGGGGSDTFTVRFGWMQYMAEDCNGLVCRHTVASEGMSAPVMFGPNEAASLDVGGDGNGVVAMVFSNDTNVQVNAMIIDAATGNVVAGEDVSQPGLVDNH